MATSPAYAQVDRSTGLFRMLQGKDSLLFEVGFNTCDIRVFEDILSDDFKF